MIRLVLACAVSGAIAVAAALLAGPSTLGFARGEPMLVASGERLAALQAVSHSGCLPTISTGDSVQGGSSSPASIRIVRLGPAGDAPLSVTDIPFDGAPGAQIVLVLDGDGRLVAAGDASGPAMKPASEHDCGDGRAGAQTPGII